LAGGAGAGETYAIGGGVGDGLMAGPLPPSAAIRMIPAAIDAAPKSMKHPNTTCTARRMSTRPDMSRSPTDATAITAIAVATLPSSVAWAHSRATAKTLAPGGLQIRIHAFEESADWMAPWSTTASTLLLPPLRDSCTNTSMDSRT